MPTIDREISEAFQRHGFTSAPIGMTNEIKQIVVGVLDRLVENHDELSDAIGPIKVIQVAKVRRFQRELKS